MSASTPTSSSTSSPTPGSRASGSTSAGCPRAWPRCSPSGRWSRPAAAVAAPDRVAAVRTRRSRSTTGAAPRAVARPTSTPTPTPRPTPRRGPCSPTSRARSSPRCVGAGLRGERAYDPAGTKDTDGGRTIWSRWLDLLETRGGVDGRRRGVQPVGPHREQKAQLAPRKEARAAYATIDEADGAWLPPEGLRDAMTAWDFERAAAVRDQIAGLDEAARPCRMPPRPPVSRCRPPCARRTRRRSSDEQYTALATALPKAAAAVPPVALAERAAAERPRPGQRPRRHRPRGGGPRGAGRDARSTTGATTRRGRSRWRRPTGPTRPCSSASGCCCSSCSWSPGSAGSGGAPCGARARRREVEEAERAALLRAFEEDAGRPAAP